MAAISFPKPFLTTEAGSERWDITAQLCAEIAALADSAGVPSLFVMIPAQFQVDTAVLERNIEGYDLDATQIDLEQPNRLLGERLTAAGVRFIDALEPFRAAHGAGGRLFGTIDHHFSPEGNALLTDLVAPAAAELLASGGPGSRQGIILRSHPLKILYVAPVEPWCRENGSSLITADLLDCVLSRDDVEVFCVFVRKPPDGYERNEPEGIDSVMLDIEGVPRWLSVVKSVTHWSSPLRQRFDNRKVGRALLDVVRDRGFRPDIVHVEHLPLVDIGLNAGRSLDAPVVYRAHNVESRLWALRVGLSDPFKKPVIAHMERSEIDAVRSVDLTLCISELDLDWARSNAPEARSEVLPCTLRLERYDRVPRMEPIFPLQMCFVGGLDWGPNADGLKWFVDSVLPKVVHEVPEAGLAVLARGSAEKPWLRDNPAIHLLPPESQAAELFASSHVSIAPLFQGGGVRIKIPESLALECPVVATEIGAEGHDLFGLTRTNDPGEYAAACVRYLEAADADETRRTLRAAVQDRYSATEQAGRLIEMWASLCGARAPSGVRR